MQVNTDMSHITVQFNGNAIVELSLCLPIHEDAIFLELLTSALDRNRRPHAPAALPSGKDSL
jgi:hypothetical protein